MKNKSCPLCGANRPFLLERLSKKDLLDSYWKTFQFNCEVYFPKSEIHRLQCSFCDLIFFDPTIPGDSFFYDVFQKFHWYYEDDKKEFGKALDIIKKNNSQKIMDIGAGQGFFLEKIKEREIVASEFSEKSIEILKKKNIPLHDPSLQEATFDLIVSFQVLEHVEDIQQYLSFIDKNLKKGGSVFLTVPNHDCPYFQETFDVLDYPPHHMTQWTERALRRLPEICGYSLIEYWQEEMRIEHYKRLLQGRRATAHSTQKKYSLFALKLANIFDLFFLPYGYGMETLVGHTHGIWMQK